MMSEVQARHSSAYRSRHVYSAIVAITVAATLLVSLYLLLFPPRPVRVVIDDVPLQVETRARTVHDLLVELGIPLRDEDVIVPSPDTPLKPHMIVTVERARPLYIEVGQREWLIYVRGKTVQDVVQAAGLLLRPGDQVWLNGRQVDLGSPLPALVREPQDGLPWWQWPVRPLRLLLRRAVPIWVRDGNMEFVIRTTAPTVGTALHQAGVDVYLGDIVRPALGEPISAYMRVTILRSTPVIIEADGQTIQTRTRAQEVADVLAEHGIYVTGLDIVTPSLAERLHANMHIKVTRVSEFVQVEDERIPYETVYVPDDELELDQRRLVRAGRPGIFRRRYRVVTYDGEEASRTLMDAWVAQTPITHVIAYGRKIVTRTLQTPDGVITYWRRIRMLATSYSASTAGVDPSRPWYGVTRLGLKMRKGIVAVDPRVIPLGVKVYVPGYGKGYAADTGSRILGRRIDLGYDDWNLVLWNNWVDVYLLTPPPPKDKINYLLPNWPRPPR